MIKHTHHEQMLLLSVVELFEELSCAWPFRACFCKWPLEMKCREFVVKSIDRLWNNFVFVFFFLMFSML